MGIATGEAELRDGDYFGMVLNRAARVMASGHGGQILVADSTAGLLGGVDLVDLGQRRLRDLPNPITIFQLCAPALRTDFPPLRTIDSNPGNLRPAVSRLIGRDADIDGVAAAMRSQRLVTLTGVGGVGKTRLALEVASILSDEFPDGVWVFELASVVDPAAVPDAVAAVLGISQQPGKTMSESVAATLEGRIRLLVFDNCEHVVDASADLIESIIAHSATVKILATSREGLGLVGERLWRVPSLEVDAAVELFAERARTLSADESTTAAEVCRRLDGIPLAIELAASRMESMTAAEVRDRLDHRFKLLIGARRGLERHQTLRHAVTWSYDLLDDSEKTLLERCSVFAGGFDVQSACAVAESDDADEFRVLDLLDALVRNRSMLDSQSRDRSRRPRLVDARPTSVATQCGAGDAHASAVRRLARNLAAATLATYVGLLGFGVENYEPVSWAEELIEPAVAAGHARLANLYVIASLCWMAGRIEDAIRYVEIGQTVLAETLHTPPHGVEGWLGAAYLTVGQPERWAELCRTQLERRRDNHVYIRACWVFALAFAGLADEAKAHTEGLIEAGVASRNPYMHSFAIGASSFPPSTTDTVRAMHACRQGLAIAQDSGNRFNESILAFNLARLEAREAVTVAAFDHLTLAVRNYHDSGNVASLRSPLAGVSVFLDRLGRFEPAATIAGFALSPLAVAAAPEFMTTIAHLRDVLGARIYESLAQRGEAMNMAAIAAYAYDQIGQARTELEQLR